MTPTLVGDVYSLLQRDGKCPVLLHIKAREKGPDWKGWRKISYFETLEGSYQKLLYKKEVNIGVRLGDDELCTIDCDTEPFLQEMLRLNPQLRETFCSCGEQARQIWGYFPGERPHQVHPLKVHKDSPLAIGLKDFDKKVQESKDDMVAIGEWRAEGGQSVIMGIHPCGRPYTWPNGMVVPKQLNLSSLIWPRDVAIPWLTARKGPAYEGASSRDESLLKRAIAGVTVERLWDHFGYQPRNGNPVCSPFREDKHPSFSIYDQGRRFKDHGASWSEHRGDSFDFYLLATKQDSKSGFKAFVELAGPGHELNRERLQPEQPAAQPVFDDGRQQENEGPSLKSSIHGKEPAIEFPGRDERPCFRVYPKPFRVNGRQYDAGIYFHTVTEKEETTEDGKPQKKEILCDNWFMSYLRVVAIVHTADLKEYSYLLEYLPHGKTANNRILFPQALLVGRLDDMMRTLRDIGVIASYEYKKIVRHYLDEQYKNFDASRPEMFWISTKLTGWHSESCFVLPSEIIGQNGSAEGVWFDGKSAPNTYAKKGDYKAWQRKVAKPCQGNPYLILALSAAFVGPLLVELNESGAGFHYFSNSTTGKTTAQIVGGSVWGSRDDFLSSWRTTDNALEAIASSRSDTFTVLDESHQVEPKHLDAAAYLLLNQKGKARLNRDSSAKQLAKWRTCVLSSGERSIEAHLERAKIDYKAGQCVRIIDINVSHGSKHGLFDDLHGTKDANEFSATLRAAAAQHYGFAGPQFVAWLLKNPKWRTGVRALLKAIIQKFSTELNAQQERVARTFCSVAVAGELAIQSQVLPWAQGSVTAAVNDIFQRWLDAQPKNTNSKEHVQILDMVASFISKHGDTRFTDIRGPQEFDKTPVSQFQARDRSGYWENIEDHRIYLFTSHALKEAAAGQDFTRVLRALEEADAFHQVGTNGTKEKAKVRKLPTGGTGRFYHIDPEKLHLQ
jgi:putative DNA primase/helicase